MSNENEYALFDGRAAFADPDTNMIQLIGTAKECCDAANKKEYGDDSLVGTVKDLKIKWEWFSTKKWIPEDEK